MSLNKIGGPRACVDTPSIYGPFWGGEKTSLRKQRKYFCPKKRAINGGTAIMFLLKRWMKRALGERIRQSDQDFAKIMITLTIQLL